MATKATYDIGEIPPIGEIPASMYAQVIRASRFGEPKTAFQIEQEGRYRTPEYYCDVCSISVRYPQICPCCQGPMTLRVMPMEP